MALPAAGTLITGLDGPSGLFPRGPASPADRAGSQVTPKYQLGWLAPQFPPD